jgi:hypothetical protein
MSFFTQKSISYTRRESKKIVRFPNKCSKIVIYLFSKFIVSKVRGRGSFVKKREEEKKKKREKKRSL